MLNINLSRADRRVCRELIHIGLERECEKFVLGIHRLAGRSLAYVEPYREEAGKPVEGPAHKRYIKIYRRVAKFDRRLERRYGNLTGGHFIECVLSLYTEGIITDEEMAPLSKQARDFIKNYKPTTGKGIK